MGDWLAANAWAAWLLAALVLGGLEVASLDLVLLMLAVGAAGGAVVAGLGLGLPIQLVAAAAVAAVGLVVVRPVAIRHVRLGQLHPTGTAALVGREAVVLAPVDAGTAGRVKLAGEVWSARSYDRSAVLAPGQTVDVVLIEGATAVVLGRDPLTAGR